MPHATTVYFRVIYISDGPMVGVDLDLYNTRVCTTLTDFFDTIRPFGSVGNICTVI